MSDSEFLSETESQLVGESRSALAHAQADGSLERLISATTEAVLAANVAPAPPVSSTWRKLGGVGLAGVLALSAGGYVATREDPPAAAARAPAPSDAPQRTEATPALPTPSPAHETVVAVDALPSVPPTPAPAASSANVVGRERRAPVSSATTEAALQPTTKPALQPTTKPALQPTTKPALQPTTDESAASLFRRANAARHGGDDTVASELYRRLLDGHPETREAATARIIYGRMRLDGGDAREALAQFEAYLARSPNGTLAEQALVGRARSLRALGRRDEERAAWTAVLRAFPESASKSEALERGR